ncbi:MAG TPA: hypothetical protein VHC49_20855 [Mycobacteriales bacterium]|nr:hypothetical protein [Mycobacteriales bacterium]
MAPNIQDIAAAEARLRARTQRAPRVDPNHAHRPPAPPPLFDISKDQADAVIASVLARIQL